MNLDTIRTDLDDYHIILKSINVKKLFNASYAISRTRKLKGQVYICGCGGSFCDAHHFSQDCHSYLLNKGASPIKSRVLAGNSGVLTAISNDFSFADVFLKELELFGSDTDTLICMSGSGNSESLVRAAKYAKDNLIEVISFTGNDGGKLKDLSNININIPSDKWSFIHAGHSLLFHIILDIIIENSGK